MRSPAELLKSAGLHPDKMLGQHFLKDPSTSEMIVRRAGISSGDVVLEIGAGLGALSLPLARTAKKVYAVEKDSRILTLLKSEIPPDRTDRIIVLNHSILDLDFVELARKENCDLIVIGNLPYNISSQILVRLILGRKSIRRCILMFQKELVQRFLAAPGGRDYGRLSVMLQYCADLKKIGDVKASMFFPRPKVDSEIIEIRFKRHPPFPADDEIFLFKVVKAAFSKRRKMLKNSLGASELDIDPQRAAGLLESAGIHPARRAETLTVQEFVRLSGEIRKIVPSGPAGR